MTLNVTFLYDYEVPTPGSLQIGITLPVDVAPGRFSFRLRAPRQVAHAVSVMITTANSQPAIFAVTDLLFETGIKSATSRTPDARSF